MPAAANLSKADYKKQIAEDIGAFTHDPLGHAMYSYPWGQEGTELADKDGPREWQRWVMGEIGDHLSNPETRFDPLRIAVASGHGIGKSALISMLAKWGMDTCVDTRIVVTANTEGQLLTKTGPEIAKWFRLALNNDWFKVNATSIVSTMPGHDKGWRLDLATWSEHNTEAFAGLHNEGKRIILIFDEASGIPPAVWEVALGALTDADTEIIWLAFGNPTQNTGDFRECFGKNRKLWKTRQIDSRTVEGTNKKYLQEIVDTYGENSDIAKVRVRGMFPSASSMQFIGSEVVDAAQSREIAPGNSGEPVIFGVDCARFGDDHSTLAIRCGRDARSRPWKRWHQQNSMLVAGDIVLEAQKWHPDAIFVDAGNIGAAIIDRLRQLLPDTPVFEVWFGSTKVRQAMFNGTPTNVYNKRSEIWTNMRDWLIGGAIPDDQQLKDDLTGPLYGFGGDDTSIMLERKKDMKKRGLASPDDGDALAVTFAEPVAPRHVPGYVNPENYGNGGYDPYGDL
ncbi:terminase [Novosphingobium sp. PY1]|uniref:Terminase large subunit n=1 Tax=Ochrobactrum sp. PW1 TaxID=1882222 RepID=A0A292GSA4_9HYPH|nr:terminase [Novosphingobium sp. PY1]BBA74407.1 terminase large subunit [Ochrobactrum sp. PW1]GFM29256.1 terminase large subunit [Novosphingobium sp. PY1]